MQVTKQLFYTFRKLFARQFDFSPQQLKPDTSPEAIFPKRDRRQLYLNFAEISGLKLPDLVLTKPWDMVLSGFGSVTVIGTFAVSLILINFFDYSKWILLFPLTGIILTLLLSRLLNPKRTVIKEPTMRAFTQRVLALNYAVLVVDDGTNRMEMELVINNIIADTAGLDVDEVTPDKRIAKDLGID